MRHLLSILLLTVSVCASVLDRPAPPTTAASRLTLIQTTARSMRTNLGAVSAPRMSTVYVLGDSIANGSAASATASVWNTLVAYEYGWTRNNLGISSARIADMNWATLPSASVINNDGTTYTSPSSITTNLVFLDLVGYNNMRDFGTDATKLNVFRYGLLHLAAYQAIPTSAKQYAQSATTSGSWTADSEYGGAMGRHSTASASTLTFSTIGSVVYVAYRATATSGFGTMTIAVDGTTYVSALSCNTSPGNRNYGVGVGGGVASWVGPNGDGSLSNEPFLIRIPNLHSGAHSVVVTATTSPIYILWAAGNGSAVRYSQSDNGPTVWLGGCLRSTSSGYSSGSDSAAGLYTRAIQEVASTLASDGLRVGYVNTDTFDPNGGGMSGDNVHPNDTGHTEIARSFINAIDKVLSPDAGWDRPSRNRFVVDRTGTGYGLRSEPAFGVLKGEGNWIAQIDTLGALRLAPYNDTESVSGSFYVNRSALPFLSHNPGHTTGAGSWNTLTSDSSGFQASSGEQVMLTVSPTVLQTGMANYVALDIPVTETSTGSGGSFLIRAKAGSTTEFSVSPAGNTVINGTASIAGAATLSSTATIAGNVTLSGGTASRALVTDGSKVITASATTSTELGYVSGVTSALQTQINAKAATANLNPSFTALTDGATITWTLSSSYPSQNASVTLGGNRTLAFSGLSAGMQGILIVTQDGTGSRTLTLPASSKVIGGGAGVITLTTTAGAVDILTWVYNGTSTYWNKGLNYN